jgi:hypothetical protein
MNISREINFFKSTKPDLEAKQKKKTDQTVVTTKTRKKLSIGIWLGIGFCFRN